LAGEKDVKKVVSEGFDLVSLLVRELADLWDYALVYM
jgi:hypothetical protein